MGRLLFLVLFPWLCLGKLCTNTGVSHTLRSQLSTFASNSLVAEYSTLGWNATGKHTGRLRRTMLQKQKDTKASPFLEPLSLHDVRLSTETSFGSAQQTNLEYLLMLDVDNLVYSFRTTAGLNASGTPYGGWENPDSELRGHFVGHYLSATAMTWASTHNLTIYKNMNSVVEALAECQAKIGNGYLSAFPSSFFDRFEALQPVWAPYYTIHKIMAGLLDQYTFADNKMAFEMLLAMADYFYGRVEAVIEDYTIERHWQSLNEETGGMNDILYRLYQLTGDDKHLRLAHLFDKPCFLGLLAIQADSVADFHANTHIPVVVGAQMRYEAVGDELFKELTEYFMEIISSAHTYATGGTSVGEFWSVPNRLGTTLGTENEESCTTYNMLKVARNLFRWKKEMKYADFYERALLNGVLTIQRGQDPGIMIYMLPLAPGSSKAKSYHGWGTPFDSFWCCYGTAIESFSKLGDSIYFQNQTEDIPHLHVIQYVSSTVTWDAAGLIVDQTVSQMTSTDPNLNVTFKFTQTKSLGKATISVRVPYWAYSKGLKYSVNGVKRKTPAPGKFVSITRKWETGQVLSFVFPAAFTFEKIQDERPEYSSLYAIYYGPYLLAGLSDGSFNLGSVNISSPSQWILPVVGNLFTFTQGSQVLARNQDGTLSMIDTPSEGSEDAPRATFKITSKSERALSSINIYDEISLEYMDQPGKYITYSNVNSHNDNSNGVNGKNDGVNDNTKVVFKVVPGLSGEEGAVSFEANGCYLSTRQESVSVECFGDIREFNGDNGDIKEFNEAASFGVTSGLTSYHPLSFEAYGTNNTYLLFPMNAYKDEKYAVYFEITS